MCIFTPLTNKFLRIRNVIHPSLTYILLAYILIPFLKAHETWLLFYKIIICLDLLTTSYLMCFSCLLTFQDFHLRITFPLPRVHASQFPLVKNSHLLEVSELPLFPWCRTLDFFLFVYVLMTSECDAFEGKPLLSLQAILRPFLCPWSSAVSLKQSWELPFIYPVWVPVVLECTD